MDLFLEMEQLFDALRVRNFDPYCSYNRNENDAVLEKTMKYIRLKNTLIYPFMNRIRLYRPLAIIQL